ncbi:aminodeoxychorismate/anthranilate synthase component II [Brachybacterium sp. EF45031]|uniref:aminodeoxychorismate/anthranilate synthase component II n=1 Tax=Brachybacterium sillae TaxID=2810536 RepID=UPI00217E3448|nr:aminodeoxychorismate/anthranilate synthase component II [Brachybacterium sillae]MCS6712070.1 aminodeoxychorismate/anthranilate synthase component II [Brachybacterium sillae]
MAESAAAGGTGARVLVIDNYDSFVFTIVGYLEQMGAVCTVVRNDAVPTAPDGTVDLTGVDGVLVSPGPGNPDTAGRSLEVIAACAAHRVPMFGVCLGHQALAQAYGATVTHAPQLMHGRTSEVHHDGQGVFAGVPSPFIATRYHSLAVVPQTVPEELLVTARTEDGVIMGLQHRTLPLHGVQFHPESVLTQHGHRLLAAFLEMCDGYPAADRAEGLAPLLAQR